MSGRSSGTQRRRHAGPGGGRAAARGPGGGDGRAARREVPDFRGSASGCCGMLAPSGR